MGERGIETALGVKAHGLDGTLVAPDWPPMTTHELEQVLPWYGLAGRVRVLSVSPRPLSAACLAEVGGQRVFVKRHSTVVRDAKALQQEHGYMEWLRAHGANVPEVLHTDEGPTTVEADGWAYEAHAPAAGVDLYEEAISWTPFACREHAHAAGAALAELHAAAQGYQAPARVSARLVAGFSIYAHADAARGMRNYLDRWPALKQFVAGRGWVEDTLAALRPFAEELRPLLPELKPLWTHNDLHASNLFWSDAGPDARVQAVIDFGLCDRTNAVHDIANAIERNCVGWLDLMNAPNRPDAVQVRMGHVWALINGYESVRRLSTAEARALAPMLAVCHVEFALSEAEYFLSALRSPERARVACEDYMVGHARWWRGAGARMLDALRAWSHGRRA